MHESCDEDGLLDTLARLTGQDYAISDSGQFAFNDENLCQGAYSICHFEWERYGPSYFQRASFFLGICGSVLELSSQRHGTLKSPGFPNNYPPEQECSWKFWLTPGSKFSMKFHTFDLESDQFCLFDYVELIEQNGQGLVTRSKLVHACHDNK